jgi:peroxiredoxin
MRKVIAFFVIALGIVACQTAKDKFTIKGSIAGVDTGKVYLQKIVDGKPVSVDSANISGGKFTFTGKMDMPDIRILRLNARDYFAQFFLENAPVNIAAKKDSLRATKITGSPSQDIFQIYIDEMQKLSKEVVGIQQRYQTAMASGNTADADKAKIDYQAMIDNNQVFTKNFIKKHSNSVVAAYIARYQLAEQAGDAELDSIVTSFPAEIAESEYVKELKKMIEERQKTAIGAVAPDFTMNDRDGKPVELSSLRGKVILVDFWASWCAPCRQENPNVVKVYNEFHPKGFEILGVSLDRSKDDWLKAIADDKLTWMHVSDLQYWQNAAARLYGVNSIPMNFLLDKDGKIIAKSLRGADLEAKLKEIYPN